MQHIKGRETQLQVVVAEVVLIGATYVLLTRQCKYLIYISFFIILWVNSTSLEPMAWYHHLFQPLGGSGHVCTCAVSPNGTSCYMFHSRNNVLVILIIGLLYRLPRDGQPEVDGDTGICIAVSMNTYQPCGTIQSMTLLDIVKHSQSNSIPKKTCS